MKAHTDAIFTEMHELLNELNHDNPLQHAEEAYQIVKAAMKKHQQYMDQYSFQDIKEEVDYFKHIRPDILSELIFYVELRALEAFKPVTGAPSVESYLKASLNIYHQFFTRNLTFYNYYRMQKKEQDAVYFVRKDCASASLPFIQPELIIESFREGSADYSYILAKIRAFERLISHINSEISKLNHQYPPEASPSVLLKWTGKKVDLIELAYAIQSTDTVNNGNASVKDIMRAFEAVFQIKSGNFYSAFLKDIRLRKDATIYLDRLKKCLIERIDQSDLNPKMS